MEEERKPPVGTGNPEQGSAPCDGMSNVGSVHAPLRTTQSEAVKGSTLNSNTALTEEMIGSVPLHHVKAEGQSQGTITSGSPDTPDLSVSDGAKMGGRHIESVTNQIGQAAAHQGNAELPAESTGKLTCSETAAQQTSEGELGVGLDLRAAGRNASDRFKRCISEIAANQWDAEAWQAAVAEAQLGRSGSTPARDVLRKFLAKFPMAGRYWKYLCELDQESGDNDAVGGYLTANVDKCASVELWQYCVTRDRNKLKDELPESRAKVVAAYERAVSSVGFNIHSGGLWTDYISFLQSWKENNATDTGSKVMALRKLYQRVIGLPIDSLEKEWKEYEAFEMSLSEHLAKNKFIPENLPRYQAAKTVLKERKQMWEGINVHMLATPPDARDTEQQHQVDLWRNVIAYERKNPENADEEGLKARVRQYFGMCLCCVRHFPEIWYDLVEFELAANNEERASKVYREAISVLPGSEMLRVGQADLEESRGRIKEAAGIWNQCVVDFPTSSFVFIMNQRFILRSKGKMAARNAFSQSYPLRASGKLGWQVYVSHAAIEEHMNRAPDVAHRILEYGLSQHASFIAEQEYVLYYVDFLMRREEEENLRVLLERVLNSGTLPQMLSAPVWDRFVQLECSRTKTGGSLASIFKVEERRSSAHPNDLKYRGLMRLWTRFQLMGVPVSCLNPADAAFVRRRDPSCAMKSYRGEPLDGQVKKTHKKQWESGGSDHDKGRERDRNRKRDRDKEQSSSIPPLIPPFLAKLYLKLPHISGPPPDTDAMITVLKSAALPALDTLEDTKGTENKRGNYGGGWDSDEEGRGGSGDPLRLSHDVFRQRQRIKLEPS